jgi:heme-degrading monooxygenase HmoA
MLRSVYPALTESLDKTLGGLAMYARVTSAEIFKEKIDQFIEIYKEYVVPAAKKQKGFRGIHLLVDRKTGNGMAISYWESEKDALANEKSLYYQEQVARFISFYARQPIRDGYDVPVQVRGKKHS